MPHAAMKAAETLRECPALRANSLLLLFFILGAWLGGSVILGAVVTYNFAGVEDLFARNPRLAEHAGFELSDEQAKKTSLLWVHSSELNRVFFQAWNRTQLVLGGLAVVLALRVHARLPSILLLLGATALVAYIHLVVEPQILDLGRQLDFLPRIPPPPALEPFQENHGVYFTLETARVLLVAAAALLLLFRSPRAGGPV